MHTNRYLARDVSYAASASSARGRALIRAVENATGRLGLIRRAAGFEGQVAGGQDFWRVMMQCYGLSLKVVGGALDNIPHHGPLIVVANHPYGILDGLIMGHILSALRGDFRILANQIFAASPDLTRVILPVSFDQTRAAVRQNLETRKSALRYLDKGGAIGVFPGGTVATAARPLGQPMDPVWRNFTARMIAQSGATVVPIFFDGQNSRWFQMVSHLSPNLRLALLIREFRKRVDAPVRIVVGEPIARRDLAAHRDEPKRMMDFLRQHTYSLSPRPLDARKFGYEFDKKHEKIRQG
ncbi:MAG: lysophospholipid acyltransferase family protein [Marinosulfonomonas sp.]|nr:lysophospholipid acyltransferase family protein [Marinosulfonomonas sp.]